MHLKQFKLFLCILNLLIPKDRIFQYFYLHIEHAVTFFPA